MRLSKIALYGFKSFAKRTEFEFGRGITGIVGPNGCGKSNLVDALRWVLGEQRPTLLRGGQMPDLVYRGHGAKVDHAEVSLMFDNSEGIHEEYEAEIEITRRVSREGQSEYSINRRPVRLKDVRELLLDTGLGVDGYSFMGQGRIDGILNASPLERRMLVEEAAGTSRYRVRRKEALRKLERTEQDLARAGDMLAELERQVRSLKIQAGKARNYVEKRARLQVLLGVVYSRKHLEIQADLAEVLAQKETFGQELELDRAKLSEAERRAADRERQESVLATEVSDVRTSLAEKKARKEHLITRISDLEARAEQSLQEQQEGQERADQMREQVEELSSRLEAVEKALQEIESSLGERRAARQEAAEALEELRQSGADLQRRLQELEQELLDLVEEQQRIRNDITDLESESRALLSSRRKLAERSVELTRSLAEYAGRHRRELQKTRTVSQERAALEAELSQDDESLSGYYQERQTLGDRAQKLQAAVSADRSRLQVLEEAVARHEGVNDQVRDLLRRAESSEPGLGQIEGILADMIVPSVETARAVEAALGPWAEALVVPHREAAIEVMQVVRKEGLDKVRVLSRQELMRHSPSNGHRCRLLEGARAREGSRALLESLLQPFDLLPPDVPMDLCSPRPGRCLVSHDGEVMLTSFETVSRGKFEHLGLITRRTECERLNSRVEKRERESEALAETLGLLAERISEREADRAERAKRLESVVENESALLQRLSGLRDRLGLLREELVLDQHEVEELDRRRQSLRAERLALEPRKAQLEQRREEVHEERHLHEERTRSLVEDQRRGEEKVNEYDLDVARLKERRDGAQSSVEEVKGRRREREEEALHLARRLSEWKSQEVAARESAAASQEELQLLGTEIEQGERDLEQRREALDQFREESSGLREELSLGRRRVEETGQKLQELQLREQERRLHWEGVQERAKEDLDFDLDLLCRIVQGEAIEDEPLPELPIDTEEDAESSSEQAEERQSGSESETGVTVIAGSGPTQSPEPTDNQTEVVASNGVDAEQRRRIGERNALKGALAEESTRELLEAPLEPQEQEAEQLRKQVQRLGPVNLEAIHDLEEVESRATFMSQQQTDLTESRKRLRVMIEDIDRECAERFQETYVAVRDHFRILFRRLFRGGRADLILETTEDPSDAGVDIVAAPPGKEPRSIAALSGGERTLTATALLFSLFSTRPSPFCVLDEVDAALDEANIERFTGMVKDFLERTQFVIVTHSKRTMAVADVIYGVTMEDNGVSQPMAIRFTDEQAEEKGAGG